MKKLIISKVNKYNNVEYSEIYNIRHKQHIDAYVGYELSLAVPEQEKDMRAIYNLKEGSYTIDLGESYLDVDVVVKY